MIDLNWDMICSQLRQEVGDALFQSWIQPIAVEQPNPNSLHLILPTRFMRDWVSTHYLEKIKQLCHQQNPQIHAIELKVKAQSKSADTQQVVPSVLEHHPPPNSSALPKIRQMIDENNLLDFGWLDPRFTFANYVTGKPNEFAYAASRRIAESPMVSFNPLFLYSGVGLGKTHLMQAIAWDVRSNSPERKVLYLSAEKFMYRFVRAIRDRDTMTFKEQFRSVDILMIDDVQFLIGKDNTQEEFFHTFNALMDQGRQIVISADKSPSDLEGLEERLRSRLSSGLIADIHPTSYELRLGILQQKAELAGAVIPQKLLEFLAYKITSNVRELEGALNRIIAHCQLVGREMTMETAEDVLRDLLRSSERQVTIEEIQKRVAEYFNIKISEMSSDRRSRQVARPRQVAIYLAKQLTSYSLPEIGRKFGGRDHTTVIHSIKKIELLQKEDQNFAEDVNLLKRTLQK